tara:strand:+ start:6658 stop:7080 length:423 start_codon:yes stop_codon:yes gene_type:complete
MEKQIIELFTPLKVKINEITIDFNNIIISNDKYTYDKYVDNEMLNKIVFELMNILDDILNKIKDLNVFYITTKNNVDTYLYYNNKKLEFNNDYFVKTSSLYLEYKNKWFGIKSDFSADIDVIRALDIRFLFLKSILSSSL